MSNSIEKNAGFESGARGKGVFQKRRKESFSFLNRDMKS